jgi:peptidyl-prolyl cis-trans isomerase SurA
MRFLVLFFLLFCFNTFSQIDSVVLEINNKPIYKSEFLQIYLKNNNNPKFDKQSIDEYLELFKKFKLKVAEAESLGYDTLPKLKDELAGYRKTLASPYLTDRDANEMLVLEAYERLKTEVRASHILVKVDMSAGPDDTLEAYNKIDKIRQRVLKGETFSVLAEELSEDPSAKTNKGDLGYFTAFQMVFPFEDMAYKTEVGAVSKIVRTRFGYHLIYVTDKRPARGIMRAAHIMIGIGKDASTQDLATAKKKIDEIYEKLEKGESFEDLALNFSDDPGSSDKGGRLPEFGSGATTRMVPEFEEAAFQLKNDGDYSRPVQTNFGFHIIKRLNVKPMSSFESMKKELQSKVNRDDRSKISQSSLIVKLKKEYDYKDLSKKNLKWFVKHIDSNYYKGQWRATSLTKNNPLFSFANVIETQKDFAAFLEKNYRNFYKIPIKDMVQKQYELFVEREILNFEEQNLENKYPEFKSLMKEYHDGVLLYEIMTNKVWNRAATDSIALKDFYERNKSNYQWKNRIDASIYECINEKMAEKVYGLLVKKNDSKRIIEIINKDSELNLKVKMNKYEISETSFLKDHSFEVGLNKPYESSGKYYVVVVDKIIPQSIKLLNECKGMVTSDFQSQIEKEWLETLSKKFPITIHDEVIYSLGK